MACGGPSSGRPKPSEAGSASPALAAALGLPAAGGDGASEPISEDGVDVAVGGTNGGGGGGRKSKWTVVRPSLVRKARQEIHQMRMSAWREALAAHEQEVSITRIFGH